MARIICAVALFITILFLALSVIMGIQLGSWNGLLDEKSLAIGYALVPATLQMLYLFRSRRPSGVKNGIWLGAILGGIIPFVLAALGMAQAAGRYSTSILTDGTLWWAGWFMPAFWLGMPALLLGAIIGGLCSWAFARR